MEMSHFTVMVITDEQPTQESLAKILQPWHEYECTGKDDEYVVHVDITDEILSEQVRAVKLADGSIRTVYADEFWEKDPDTGKLKQVFPEGAAECRVGFLELTNQREHLERYHEFDPILERGDRHPIKGAYAVADGDQFVSAFRYTNPNAKWDWWSIGGRWSGALAPKERVGVTGSSIVDKGVPGVMGSQYDEAGVDICQKGNLDIEKMRRARIKRRREALDEAYGKLNMAPEIVGAIWQAAAKAGGWASVFEKYQQSTDKVDGERARDWAERVLPDEDPVKVALVSGVLEEIGSGMFGVGVPDNVEDIEHWVENAPFISSWAVVYNGEWSEKGSMGWFGMSSDDKDEREWEAEVSSLVESLSDEQWISMVDCHI
jgi:hypothetical protein